MPFDRILLDAPCSGLGVIRRHPDIRLRKSPSDIDKLPALQGKLLKAAWDLLAPGGRLVYVTCTRHPQRKPRRHCGVLGEDAGCGNRSGRKTGKAGRVWARPMSSGGRFFPVRRVPTASIMLL